MSEWKRLVAVLVLVTCEAAVVSRLYRAPWSAGPQPVPCPRPSVRVSTSDNLQAAIEQHHGATIFCIAEGTHLIRGSIRPKTGDEIVCEFGGDLVGATFHLAASRFALRNCILSNSLHIAVGQ